MITCGRHDVPMHREDDDTHLFCPLCEYEEAMRMPEACPRTIAESAAKPVYITYTVGINK